MTRGGRRPGTGRPRLPRGEQHRVTTMLRLTPEQADLLRLAAERAGITRAALAREIVVDRIMELGAVGGGRE